MWRTGHLMGRTGKSTLTWEGRGTRHPVGGA